MIESFFLVLELGLIVVLMFAVKRGTESEEQESLGIFSYTKETKNVTAKKKPAAKGGKHA